ncbi:MAG: exodeoxyribonuclease III [Calothrix sp. SM1_5_4]|nr:exodeoxyribonuclease III [Calothrix sp. SM1_5_4]
MKIITWNVNGLRSVVRKGFHEFWERQDPDIFCLQETKCHPDQLDLAAVVREGYHAHWSAARRAGYSGTATFSKENPRTVRQGFGIPKFDAEGRMVVSEFAAFALYNCYFPNGGASEERHVFKQEFLRRFSRHLHKRVAKGDNVIVVGDYNVAYLDIDVYDPAALSAESGFLPEERRWMKGFLEQGFVDAFRYLHPDEKHRFTWWSYLQNSRMGNRGWRIDHICVSRNLEKKLKSVDILDQQTGSDHCPVVMEIDL